MNVYKGCLKADPTNLKFYLHTGYNALYNSLKYFEDELPACKTRT